MSKINRSYATPSAPVNTDFAALFAQLDNLDARVYLTRSYGSWQCELTVTQDDVTVESKARGDNAAEALATAWRKLDAAVETGLNLPRLAPPIVAAYTSDD